MSYWHRRRRLKFEEARRGDGPLRRCWVYQHHSRSQGGTQTPADLRTGSTLSAKFRISHSCQIGNDTLMNREEEARQDFDRAVQLGANDVDLDRQADLLRRDP